MERKTKVPVTRVSMWYDQSDFELDLGFAQEFLENDSNFRVVLFRVDHANTQVDDVYNESDPGAIRFHPPVEILISALHIEQSEMNAYAKNGGLTRRDRGKLEFAVLSSTLKDKGVDISIGDFIGYAFSEAGLEYWMVYEDGRMNMDNQHTLYGTRPYYRSIKCSVADPNIFNGI